MVGIYMLIYAAFGVLGVVYFQEYFNSLPQIVASLAGVAIGVVCAFLAILTDVIIYLRRSNNLG